MVRDFNYGVLHQQNKPSALCLERSNLGQNAMQLYTIMIHLPFIFAEYREKLEKIWISVESLLRMMQIVYSRTISEDDIQNLALYIEAHYQFLIGEFKSTLLPKHHIVLHYPNAIRKMGPLINYWMMRFESKHQFFTRAAQQTRNFINIAKTLARKHQEYICYKSFATDSVEFAKKFIRLEKHKNFIKFREQIAKFLREDDIDGLKVVNFAKLNCFVYREGLMLVSNGKVFEIVLLMSRNDNLTFFCCPYKIKNFDPFYSSIEIERKTDNVFDFEMFELKDLKNPQSYDRKFSMGKIFIICDTLEFKNLEMIIEN